jgi:DeoR/GlpR family transcriptional regulator of sugar metabolism
MAIMLTTQRRKLILERVRRHGQVAVNELSKEWNLSEDAIRRDLRELARQGVLQRVHGGAISTSPAIGDYTARESLSTEIKDQLAKVAAEMVEPGQVIGIDGGTTNLHLIRHLRRDLKITVVTHSPTIAAELRHHDSVEVLLLGGKLFKHSMVTLGAETLSALERIHLDIFFLGATGAHPDAGITTGDWEEAGIKRAFCSRAAELVLIASPEKLNAASPHLIIPSNALDVLIVSDTTPEQTNQSFKEKGVEVFSVK